MADQLLRLTTVSVAVGARDGRVMVAFNNCAGFRNGYGDLSIAQAREMARRLTALCDAEEAANG